MEEPKMTGARSRRSDFVRPGTTYAMISYSTVGVASSSPAYPATCQYQSRGSTSAIMTRQTDAPNLQGREKALFCRHLLIMSS